MAEEQFKSGDVVQLRSGGPKMTVNDIVSGRVECMWFSEGNKLENGRFNKEALKLVTKSNSGPVAIPVSSRSSNQY